MNFFSKSYKIISASNETPYTTIARVRLSNELAFSMIGVDYAGPMYVKDIYSSSKDMHKVYISLYTCASSRAVHLDLVPNMSSEAFVRSLERFIGRPGIPSLIISDNRKTFKGPEIRNLIASKNIKWRYIVEKSPGWGGFYERMVRSVKRCLKKVLRYARLSYEELLTYLIRVEGVLNSRPLTYVYPDQDEPLTPSHFVLGKRILTIPGYRRTKRRKKQTVKERKAPRECSSTFLEKMEGGVSNAVAGTSSTKQEGRSKCKSRRCRSDSRRQREAIKLAHRGDREFTERKRRKRSSGDS